MSLVRLATVPGPRYLSVASPSLFFRSSPATIASSRGRATRQEPVPLKAMALRFLEPITAPEPVRPACLPSLVMQAYRTKASPAGPIATIRISWSFSRALTRRSVSLAAHPARYWTSRNSTLSSWSTKQVKWGALPVITRASNGMRLSSSATGPEDRESPMKSVRGDLQATANLEVEGMPTPARVLPVRIRGASGERGSTPLGAQE